MLGDLTETEDAFPDFQFLAYWETQVKFRAQRARKS